MREKLKNSKKVEQLKEFKEKLDIVWSNPKSHAVIMLSFWFIVILFLSLFVRFSGNSYSGDYVSDVKYTENVQEPTGDSIKKDLSSINSFDGKVLLDDVEFHITKVLSNELIIYNNETYYFDDTLYLLSNKELVPIENDFLSDIIYIVNNIYDLVDNGQEEYITIYKDNSYVIGFSTMYYDNLIDITLTGLGNIKKIGVIMPNYKFEIHLENINNIDKIVLEGVV